MPSPLTSVTQLRPRNPLRRLPSVDDLKALPRAACGEYELSERETKRLRAQIYSINKHNVAGMRFRTLREGSILVVWRIH